MLKIVANDLRKASSRERDRATVAELVLADWGAQLREEAHRELISIEVSNDCWTQCGFLRVSMKSLLWLWLLREIVAENAKEECETVFRATGFKIPMVPYLNESCMSLSGLSSGPHGQTSDPAHVFSSGDMSNEVRYKSCNLHKSIYTVLQRDHCVCFGSHSGIPADPALRNMKFPGFFSVLWWRQLVHVPFDVSVGGSCGGDLFWNAGVSWEQRANVHGSLSRLF